MKTAVLKDGAAVTLRPIRPEDDRALTALYARLSPQSSYQRFFTGMRRLPSNWVHILSNVDYDRSMAMVGLDPGDELIGVVTTLLDRKLGLGRGFFAPGAGRSSRSG